MGRQIAFSVLETIPNLKMDEQTDGSGFKRVNARWNVQDPRFFCVFPRKQEIPHSQFYNMLLFISTEHTWTMEFLWRRQHTFSFSITSVWNSTNKDKGEEISHINQAWSRNGHNDWISNIPLPTPEMDPRERTGEVRRGEKTLSSTIPNRHTTMSLVMNVAQSILVNLYDHYTP